MQVWIVPPTPPKRTRKKPEVPTPVVRGPWWPFARDIALFTGGLAGVGYETLGRDIDRPTLLLLFAAMMGLPAFFPKGEK